MGTSYEQEYYEDEAHWSQVDVPREAALRVNAVKEVVLGANTSILDMGCGNGLFCNDCAADGAIATVVGMDRSITALQHVRVNPICGDATTLPFKDGSVDAIVAMEVIEHLPHISYRTALKEMARVMKRCAIITVPYRENLKATLVPCPLCRCRFQPNWHLRTFDEVALANLFSGIDDTVVCSQIERLADHSVFLGERIIRAAKAAVMGPTYKSTNICPQCGFKPGALSWAHRIPPQSVGLNRIFAINENRWVHKVLRCVWPKLKRPRWYMAVYGRIS